jgi:hypothetical protein
VLRDESAEPEKISTSFRMKMPDGSITTFKNLGEYKEWAKIK